MSKPPIGLRLALLALPLAACGPTVIRGYPGEARPPQEVASLWSNEHLTMSVDEQTIVHTGDLTTRKRVELLPGRHVVTVMCRFPESVEYRRVDAGNGRAVETSRLSRPKSFVLVAEGGHTYMPRVRFGPDQGGRPECEVLFPDITGEPKGHELHTF